MLEAVKYAIEREHAMELAEWNETAQDVNEDDKGSRLNFADLVMTPSDKKENDTTEKKLVLALLLNQV